MKKLSIILIYSFSLFLGVTRFDRSALSGDSIIRLCPGFIRKFECSGRLLVSAVGDESVLQLQVLPKEVGCGFLLKPLAQQGHTNFLVETSQGAVISEVIVDPSLAQCTTKTPLPNRKGG